MIAHLRTTPLESSTRRLVYCKPASSSAFSADTTPPGATSSDTAFEAVTEVEAVFNGRLETVEIGDRLFEPAEGLAQPRVDRLEALVHRDPFSGSPYLTGEAALLESVQ